MSKEIIIGRSTEDCDIVISGDMTVSRIHCSVELLWNGKYRLTDLKSRNGTFYNGEKINVCDLNAFDVFQVGKQLIYGNGQLVDKLQNAAIEVVDITKSYDGLRHVVQKTSFAIKNGSLTAIMGPSGCGKSTLLKLLNGMIPPTAGDVKVFGIDLKTSFNNIKNKIGYVPQDDTIHLELTVYQSLYFAAKLRLKGYTNSEIEKRINELLQKLNISAIKQKRNSEISGGQRKRVCIAIELLSNPLVLLLDEPTSPLDPQTISEFMSILKLLASDETTVILVTHKPEDLDFMDEVIFLNVAGATRFKGSPLGCLNAFNATNYTEIYKILSEEVSEKQSHLKVKGNVVYTDPTEYLSKSKVRWFNQFFWLTNRNLRVKTNDLYNTLILFVQAPIIAILVGLVFDELSLAVIFMTVISGIWFGVNNSAREIVKEKKHI
jgi:ABC-type multidrug transport system ATPase subunit